MASTFGLIDTAALGLERPAAPNAVTPRYRRILLPLVVGASEFATRDLLLAQALRLRGAAPLVVLCDGLPVCDLRSLERHDPGLCEACYPAANDRWLAAGIETVALSSCIDLDRAAALRERALSLDGDALVDGWYAGARLGPAALASTLRFLRVDRIDDDPDRLALLREYLAAAWIAADAARHALDRLAPDRVAAPDRRFASWGVWRAIAGARGVPFVSWGPAMRDGALALREGDAPWTFDATSRALTSAQLAEFDDQRTTLADVDRDDPDLDALGIDPARYDRCLLLLAEEAWRAAVDDLERPAGLFGDRRDWVATVLETVARHPRCLLLTTDDAIANGAPDNVRAVPEHTSVATLVRAADAVLAYRDPRALDLALAGLPVLSAGAHARHDHDGVVIRPSDRDGFATYLAALIDGSEPFVPDAARTRRVAWACRHDGVVPFGGLPNSIASLLPGGHPGLDALCDAILAGVRR